MVEVCHPGQHSNMRLRCWHASEFFWIPCDWRSHQWGVNYLNHAHIVNFLCHHRHRSSLSCTNIGGIPLLPFRTFRFFSPGLLQPKHTIALVSLLLLAGWVFFIFPALLLPVGLDLPFWQLEAANRLGLRAAKLLSCDNWKHLKSCIPLAVWISVQCPQNNCSGHLHIGFPGWYAGWNS